MEPLPFDPFPPNNPGIPDPDYFDNDEAWDEEDDWDWWSFLKKTIDVSNKQIKTFSFDLLKVLPKEIDKVINEFLLTVDGEETEFNVFPTESLLIISIIYDREDH